ncbi:hypothetical protein Bhyg_04579, partial [Pseudolycoriella hygida]
MPSTIVKALWIHRLRMGKKPSRFMVVCSEHFENSDYHVNYMGENNGMLKKGTVPSRNLPLTSLESKGVVKRKVNKSQSARLKRAVVSNMPSSPSAPVRTYPAAIASDTNLSNMSIDYCPPTPNIQSIDLTLQETVDVAQGTASDVALVNDIEMDEVVERQNKSVQVKPVKPEVRTVQYQVNFGSRRITFDSLVDSDVKYATGLDRERFLIVFRMLERFSPISDSQFWTRKDALLITMYKLRHNLDYLMMQFHFQIPRQSIAAIFREVIVKLYLVFKQIDIWNISHCDAKSYRTLLDCTEMYVFGSENPIFQQLLFSTYRDHPTFKLLVGCDEKGAVNFISEAFVGSISDREITVKSGIIELLKEGDAILADKGFDVSDLFESKKVLVNIPPFLKNKVQLSSFQVMKTRVIANRRILIENVN